MLSFIADHPLLFACFVFILTSVPTFIWWHRYSSKTPDLKGITCGCGMHFQSVNKFEMHQKYGNCPQALKINLPRKKQKDSKPIPSTGHSLKSKSSKKSIKITPRSKTGKKKVEEVISINEFAKSTAKIVISKR